MKTALALLWILTVFVAGCTRHDSWTTESGLQVTELVTGDGELASKGDVVSMLYTASFVGGKTFDVQQDRESPYRFRAGMSDVLPGLEEGVSTMRPGSKRVLVLPPALAFGEDGIKGTVPPGTSVRFEVEVVEIRPMPPGPSPWNDAGLEIETTSSGLQYVDFYVGDGEQPRLGAQVVVHYSAYLDDGELFDTTRYKGVPLEFLMDSQLLAGWLEGLSTMRVGGLRKLIVPPYLAYGDKGQGNRVPPNATLTFDIELVAIR